MLGAVARQHLLLWRFEKTEDQRVLGAVCAGAGAAWGPLHGSGVSNGLNATVYHTRKMSLERFRMVLSPAEQHGEEALQVLLASGSGGDGCCCLVGSKDAGWAGLSKQHGNRVVLNTAFRVFFLVCSNPDLFSDPVAKSAGNRAS